MTLLGRSRNWSKQVGRDLTALVFAEAQLEAARHAPAVRRGALGGAAALIAGVALLATFVFLNVAAYVGLTQSLSAWASALVLAGAWLVVGGAIAACPGGPNAASPCLGALLCNLGRGPRGARSET